jgi:hypothetical protein
MHVVASTNPKTRDSLRNSERASSLYAPLSHSRANYVGCTSGFPRSETPNVLAFQPEISNLKGNYAT